MFPVFKLSALLKSECVVPTEEDGLGKEWRAVYKDGSAVDEKVIGRTYVFLGHGSLGLFKVSYRSFIVFLEI